MPHAVCDERPTCPLRPLVLPGIGYGPHGFDTWTAESLPNICSQWPLAVNVADRTVDLDPADERVFGPMANSASAYAGVPYQALTYSLGAWP